MEGIIVIPCYNAEKTIEKVIQECHTSFNGPIVCCDDFSQDSTSQKILKTNAHLIQHSINKGYGANQKTLFNYALDQGAQHVIMVHGDNQYTPLLTGAISKMMKSNLFDIVCASRILSGSNPLTNGMPLYKYIINRSLTFFQNLFLGSKLSEFHSGYRAYSREFLQKVPFNEFDDDFSFDNQMLVWAIKNNFRIGEISCPTRYDHESSSIDLKNGITYALKCVLGTF